MFKVNVLRLQLKVICYISKRVSNSNNNYICRVNCFSSIVSQFWNREKHLYMCWITDSSQITIRLPALQHCMNEKTCEYRSRDWLHVCSDFPYLCTSFDTDMCNTYRIARAHCIFNDTREVCWSGWHLHICKTIAGIPRSKKGMHLAARFELTAWNVYFNTKTFYEKNIRKIMDQISQIQILSRLIFIKTLQTTFLRTLFLKEESETLELRKKYYLECVIT